MPLICAKNWKEPVEEAALLLNSLFFPPTVYINDVISIRSMNVTPSPLVIPGKISASISLLVKRHLASTTKLKLDIEKKVFGAVWMSIPCVSNYGSW